MATTSPTLARAAELRRRGRFHPGDTALHGITLAAALAAVALLGLIAWKVIDQARPAMSRFGLHFLVSKDWDPGVRQIFGAAAFVFGTAVTSLGALLIAGPLSIAIALFLTELAPRWLRTPVLTLVELLAAIPSVILGLWGILVFGPWIAHHLEPWLQKWLGFLPIFSGDPSQAGMLPAALVLTIMIIPITASICRELFSRVPSELEQGALALGATRWETIRGVTIPYAGPGIVAAVLLGLGRAFGEAIAVTQVIGNSDHLSRSVFAPADTLASKIASSYQGAGSNLEVNSILYLAAILLVISLITNVIAQLVVRRFQRSRGAIT